MKKLLFSILIVLALALEACSSTTTGTPVSSTGNDLPIAAQLAVGTLKLAGTAQDITAEQAEVLILYWQVYQELSQSETSAQAEVDGLIAQIQETLTDEQMQAITDMNLTQQDVSASIQGMALVPDNASESTISVPSSSDGMPAGGPPADGGAPPDGGAMPADMGEVAPASGVDQAQASETGSGLAGTAGVPMALVQAVIQSLQQKITA